MIAEMIFYVGAPFVAVYCLLLVASARRIS